MYEANLFRTYRAFFRAPTGYFKKIKKVSHRMFSSGWISLGLVEGRDIFFPLNLDK